MGKPTGGRIETDRSRYMHAYERDLTDELGFCPSAPTLTPSLVSQLSNKLRVLVG